MLAQIACSAQRLRSVPVSTLRHQFRLGLRRVIDGAAAADVVEMRVEEAPGRALAQLAQRLEIFVVPVERAARGNGLVQVLHHDAMKPQAPEFATAHSPRQSPVVDEPVDESDAAQLGQEGGVEPDFVYAVDDLARACWHLAPLAR